MQDVYQKTLSQKVVFKGIGLHSGRASTINVMPAQEGEGIVFKRIDLNENNIIKANFKNVCSARLCTTLENNFGVKVSTVEHLLAAFYIIGIDNALVEIDNEEVPIMDGSSKEFLNILKEIELIEQTFNFLFSEIYRIYFDNNFSEILQAHHDLQCPYTS